LERRQGEDMLEFNQWYFVLVVNFLILLVVLNAILFQPLKKVFKEREAATKGALDEAKDMEVKKEESVAKMNAELTGARTKAKQMANALKEEGLSKQKEALSKAEAGAVEMIEKARKELQTEADKARATLRADVEKFSDEIVRKLVNV
jgi:F-type H+-transporting ATPase subunit b